MANPIMVKAWEVKATKQFVGRKIVAARYMTREEADNQGWDSRPLVLQLDDGNLIYPSRDDEGNDAGALFTNHATDGVFGVIR